MEDDTKVRELSLEIYKKYKEALDIIYEYKPDQQQNIKDMIDEILKEIKKETGDIILLPSAKNYIRFTTPKLHEGFDNFGSKKWLKGKDLLVFEIFNHSSSDLTIKLIVGPSDNKENRDLVIEKARQNKQGYFILEEAQIGQRFIKGR